MSCSFEKPFKIISGAWQKAKGTVAAVAGAFESLRTALAKLTVNINKPGSFFTGINHSQMVFSLFFDSLCLFDFCHFCFVISVQQINKSFP